MGKFRDRRLKKKADRQEHRKAKKATKLELKKTSGFRARRQMKIARKYDTKQMRIESREANVTTRSGTKKAAYAAGLDPNAAVAKIGTSVAGAVQSIFTKNPEQQTGMGVDYTSSGHSNKQNTAPKESIIEMLTKLIFGE